MRLWFLALWLFAGQAIADMSESAPNIMGATDSTLIGNAGDRFKVEASQYVITRTDLASSARTSSGTTGTLDAAGFGEISTTLNVTAVSGTNPTLDFYIDVSDDQSNWTTFNGFQRATAATNLRQQAIRLAGRYYRYGWTIGGTATPTFTFSVTTTLKPYQPIRNSSLFKYADLALNSASTSSVFSSRGCANVSVIALRDAIGSGTASITAQVSMDQITWSSLTGSAASIGMTVGASGNTNFIGQAFLFYRFLVTNTVAAASTASIYWSCNGGS